MNELTSPTEAAAVPTLEELQSWTAIIGTAQQKLMEHAVKSWTESAGTADLLPTAITKRDWLGDGTRFAEAQADFWKDSISLWQHMLSPEAKPSVVAADKDRRFSAAQWRDNPLFDLIRQSYLLLADHLMRGVDKIDGIDAEERRQLRFLTQATMDAIAPSNFVATNPEVLERIFETKGKSLLKGISNLIVDIEKGQLTQSDTTAFELGRNIAATPGKVVKETPLYQLIQYEPSTKKVDATPLLIFPPWINRFYILDLNPKNSFVKWAVDQGLTVFVVSWKSADSSMADVTMDDYVLNGQVDALNTVLAGLDVPSAHLVGYCVAGTALSMALAWLEAKGQADKVASATFLTTQVDFSEAGDLKLFTTDEHLAVISSLAEGKGYLDGRYMAATFNLLRGRDLIWNYVVENYLLGKEYRPFDLLFWNGETTNLPAKWHKAYLEDFYRGNKLIQPGAMKVGDTPIALSRVQTPTYVQAGREDHIAPVTSVWKMTQAFSGPCRFVLAGSGHIAGVVNPPSAQKYQYWTCDHPANSFEQFVAKAKETPGSWWSDWAAWIAGKQMSSVDAKGARIPGNGILTAIEQAPGRYAKAR